MKNQFRQICSKGKGGFLKYNFVIVIEISDFLKLKFYLLYEDYLR